MWNVYTVEYYSAVKKSGIGFMVATVPGAEQIVCGRKACERRERKPGSAITPEHDAKNTTEGGRENRTKTSLAIKKF